MKTATKVNRKSARVVDVIPKPAWWYYAAGLLATIVVAFQVYAPALHGEFVFDDLHMPFLDPNAADWALKVWLGVRPFLMTTFWANYQVSGVNPYGYHVVNVLLHAGASFVLFFVVRRILQFAENSFPYGNRVNRDRKGAEPFALHATLLSLIAAFVFLLHPMQTEAVSYISQRGENMGALLYFAAFSLFLYRRNPVVSWPATAAILVLFGLAVITKEHTVTLPALLLLTDYYWNPDKNGKRFTFEGIKRNWRLYAVVAAGGLAGAAFVWRYISRDTTSIGFQLQEYSWSQYLFTQFRAFFAYIGLFLLPLWQTIDYDFPVSHNLLEHGSAIALAAILLLVIAAVRYRRTYPLASYGFFVFGLLLLPTSSVVPLKDALADRRLYLPMIGLLFIALEFLRRWKVKTPVLVFSGAAVCLILSIATYQRNEKWGTALSLWADAANKSPDKPRVQFGLGVSQFFQGKCHEAIPHFEKAIALGKPDFSYYMDLGMAYDCDHQPEKALRTLDQSIQLNPTAKTWASIALVQAKLERTPEAMESLEKAERLDPNVAMVYLYRGGIYQAMSRWQDAAFQYRRALSLEPHNQGARNGLDAVTAQLGSRR